MTLAKLSTLTSTFPGPGLPPEWVSNGLPAQVIGNAALVSCGTDFATSISTAALYDPTSSSIYGKLGRSSPASYTITTLPAFTPYNRIGAQQPGGAQCKTLVGYYPGFTVGQSATGQMKPTMDNFETAVNDHVEAVGIGMPNSLGDCSSQLAALSGETRFVVFAVPMVPNPSSGTKGSITALLRGDYDALIIDMTTKMVAAGFGGVNVSCRIGWEYNAGAGVSSTSGFPWATNYGDPQNSGNPNGIAQYKLGAAYFENLMVAHGYTGYVEWNGGNHDTSALSISAAMPTHATGTRKARTLWGWDLYAATPYNVGKDNVSATWSAINSIYDGYLTWIRANGYKMAHGEFGMGYASNSQYSLNDNTTWMPLLYAKMAANAADVCYAMYYGQNQPYTAGLVLTESHQFAFCGGKQGVPSTTVGTGPNAIGATTLYGNGTAVTSASMGTLHNVADSGTWVLTNDPNRTGLRDSMLATFFGGSVGKGAANLGVPYVSGSSSRTAGPVAIVSFLPGGSHNPVPGLSLEFDYNATLSQLTSAGVDDGTGVSSAASASSIWWRVLDNGTNVLWQTSADGATWSTLRTSARPSWWTSVDGVRVTITSHADTGSPTVSPLAISNINNGAPLPPAPDIAKFDRFNITAAPPGAVTNLSYFLNGNAVSLTWGPPVSGVPTSYIVTPVPLNTLSPAIPAQSVTTLTATFLNVPSGGAYVFVVAAVNAAGEGLGISTPAITPGLLGGGTVAGGGTTGATASQVLPNSLPIGQMPASYTPLLLTSGPDDGDTLAAIALQRQADLVGNGYRPYAANPEVAAVQIGAYMAADLRALVRAVGEEMFAAHGQQVLELPQHWDGPSQIVTTWTAVDSSGYTVPAGTQLSYPGSGSTPLTFTLRGDLVIEAGSATATNVVMLSDQTGAYTNQVPLGPLELQAPIVWLSGVTVTTAASGGQDAESGTDYLNRLVRTARTLTQTLVQPADFADAAQLASPSVYRALAVANYDAGKPDGVGLERTVSIFLIGADGLPVSADVAADVQTVLAARRETNFRIIALDSTGATVSPVYVPVTVDAAVVARTGYALIDVKAAAEKALSDYLDPAFWDGGRTSPATWTGQVVLRPHELSTVLAGVPGVDHIDQISVGGGATAVAGSDNYQLAPSSFTRAVLPAGTYAGSHWGTPTSVTVTVNPPGYS